MSVYSKGACWKTQDLGPSDASTYTFWPFLNMPIATNWYTQTCEMSCIYVDLPNLNMPIGMFNNVQHDRETICTYMENMDPNLVSLNRLPASTQTQGLIWLQPRSNSSLTAFALFVFTMLLVSLTSFLASAQKPRLIWWRPTQGLLSPELNVPMRSNQNLQHVGCPVPVIHGCLRTLKLPIASNRQV